MYVDPIWRSMTLSKIRHNAFKRNFHKQQDLSLGLPLGLGLGGWMIGIGKP